MAIIITTANYKKYFEEKENIRIAKAPLEKRDRELKEAFDKFTGKETFGLDGLIAEYGDRAGGYDMEAIKRAYPDIDFEIFRKPATKVLTLKREAIA